MKPTVKEERLLGLGTWKFLKRSWLSSSSLLSAHGIGAFGNGGGLCDGSGGTILPPALPGPDEVNPGSGVIPAKLKIPDDGLVGPCTGSGC